MSFKKTAIILGTLSLLTAKNLNAQENKYFLLENKNQTEITPKVDTSSYSKQNQKIKEFVENAREYIGTTYSWGGRLTKKNPGLDCLGLLFIPYSETFGTKWYDFSVYPSQIVEKNQLGKPVKGLDGILSEDVQISNLQEGDIIYLLSKTKIQDKPLAKINGIEYWPWHTGIYSNKKENLFLEASPFSKVIERDFSEVLKENIGIFVTRINP